MKIKLLLLFFGLLSVVACSNKSGTGKGAVGSGSEKLTAEIDSVSYSLGVDVGNSLKQAGFEEMNLAAFSDAINTVLNNDSVKIKIEATRPIITAYLEKAAKVKGVKNKKEGEDFLAENKTKKGVITTASGLQYIVLKEGNGPIPADTSMVKVHYHGTLIDGTVFDSSIDRNEPAEFPVNGVVAGWQEVLKMMPVGSKWKVFLPTQLAYGENVRPGSKIQPNMVLIFDMELLEILPPQQQEQQFNPANFKTK